MKFLVSLLVSVFSLASVGAGAGQLSLIGHVLPGRPVPSSAYRPVLPDLVVVDVYSDDLDHGVVKVKIKNQGQRNALVPRVGLAMTWGSKTTTFANGAPTMEPGSTHIVIFDVKLSLVQAKYCATVDPPNKVLESNENNNKLCGQFEGKP
ncbi:MAG: CARDB domain-containing protein [Pyrinomonadaceae bacterium]